MIALLRSSHYPMHFQRVLSVLVRRVSHWFKTSANEGARHHRITTMVTINLRPCVVRRKLSDNCIKRRRQSNDWWGAWFIIVTGCMLAGCSPQQGSADRPFLEEEAEQVSSITDPKNSTEPAARDTNLHAFFGNLHVHSGWSYDTHLIGTPATPDDAYRFAKGEEIALANGARIRL